MRRPRHAIRRTRFDRALNLLELVAVLIAGAVIFVLGGARSFVAWSVVGVVVIGLVLLEALRRTRLRRQTPRSS